MSLSLGRFTPVPAKIQGSRRGRRVRNVRGSLKGFIECRDAAVERSQEGFNRISERAAGERNGASGMLRTLSACGSHRSRLILRHIVRQRLVRARGESVSSSSGRKSQLGSGLRGGGVTSLRGAYASVITVLISLTAGMESSGGARRKSHIA